MSEGIVGLTEEEIDSYKDEPIEDEVTEETLDENNEEVVEETVESTQEEEIEVKDAQQFVPEFKSKDLTGIEDRYKTLDTDYNALSEKLSDRYEIGELSFTEFQKESRDLNALYFSEKTKLDSEKLKSEIAIEQSKQIADQRWQWEQDIFFKDNKAFKDDPVLYGALDATLKAMYQDQANTGKNGLEMLREAAKRVNARFEITIPAQKIQDQKQKARPELPKTLANIPAADSNIESGEFDYIDKLSGLAYEAAIAKMSDEQRDRFLSS